ncbi:predicted protein [Naegleria gruberi]|uniref:Predicted protein n=1 Tax=Naegleria gruberi TaxID=5762 RepID=D2VTU5_NAEGR|nr:uncharacterized protein NAEGRDRAFT_72430 [Naegleria gruberi]EFC39713.1 predicted protein [Naegleria gruberi]|eukprot:XP_002672457.1 predicted protein [Naegleria gruberi strain NEG-M]
MMKRMMKNLDHHHHNNNQLLLLSEKASNYLRNFSSSRIKLSSSEEKKIEDLINISQINIDDEPITSKWIKLRRMKYIQNGVSKTWDIAMVNDSVSCLIYQKTRQEFIIIRQFRPSILARQLFKENPIVQNVNISSDKIEYTFELCAGLKDKNLPPNETIQAEVEEECGYRVPISNIQHVNTYYTSTASSASMQHLYYIEMDDESELKWKVSEGGGLESEGEILLPFRLPLSKVSSFLKDGPKPSTLIYAITWWFLEKATKEQRDLFYFK